MDAIIAADVPEAISKLTELSKQLADTTAHVENLLSKVRKGAYGTKEGLSFLEMKLHLLLQYLANLAYMMLIKVEGRNIENEPVIERLVEIRTVMEKLRPIDKKLKYLVDKLLKLATSNANDTDNHPLSFKPNIDMLASKGDESDSAESEDERQTGVYVPPKVTAVPYDEESESSKKVNKAEKLRLRALNSSLLKELRSEYSEEPEEIREDYHSTKLAKIREKVNEMEQYEEDNMRRLQLTKKDKQMRRKLSNMNELTNFGSFGSFDAASDSEGETYQPKKKKTKLGPGKKPNKKLMRKKNRRK